MALHVRGHRDPELCQDTFVLIQVNKQVEVNLAMLELLIVRYSFELGTVVKTNHILKECICRSIEQSREQSGKGIEQHRKIVI